MCVFPPSLCRIELSLDEFFIILLDLVVRVSSFIWCTCVHTNSPCFLFPSNSAKTQFHSHIFSIQLVISPFFLTNQEGAKNFSLHFNTYFIINSTLVNPSSTWSLKPKPKYNVSASFLRWIFFVSILFYSDNENKEIESLAS